MRREGAGSTFGTPGAAVLVYTAIVGGYDLLLPPRIRESGVRRVVFSERPPRPAWGWEWRPLPRFAATLPPALANRWCKFFAHEILPEARLSIYIDGNIRLTGPVRPLVAEFAASGAALGLFAHPDRTNLEEEADTCLHYWKIGTKEDHMRLRRQLDRYQEGGLFPQFGLTENSIIFRDHADPAAAGGDVDVVAGTLHRGGARPDQPALGAPCHGDPDEGLAVELPQAEPAL